VNVFQPTERAVELMHVFFGRERDDVLHFLEDYERVCDYFETVRMNDEEWREALETVSDLPAPWDEADDENILKMLEESTLQDDTN